MIRTKDGVSLDNVHHRIFLAIALAAPIWAKYGSPELWVTAANEGGHTTNPDPWRQLHRLPDGTCRAADVRTWTIPHREDRRVAITELGTLLGGDFHVRFEEELREPTSGKILRGEHGHIQVNAP